ncbi:MAG: tetratricopeptide repeat protein [Deltaproteobacteria bacterium]|nr:tetratricopeptide repeat protein [Deltaproteobacteria bacterium]
MGTFGLMSRSRSRLCTWGVALPLLIATSSGCISQMQVDIKTNQERLDSLEADLEAKRKELTEALAEASRLLRRNSADQGLQIEEIIDRLAVMEGEIAELRMESSGVSKQQLARNAELQRQLSQVARAAGMDVPLESSQIPDNKKKHYEAAVKAYRIKEHSYARALLRSYVERYPNDSKADDAQYMVGSSYLRQGQPAAALGEFRKVISKYRKGDVLDKTLYDMAQAFLQVKSCNDAETALKALLKNHRKSSLVPKAKKQLRKVRQMGSAECADR